MFIDADISRSALSENIVFAEDVLDLANLIAGTEELEEGIQQSYDVDIISVSAVPPNPLELTSSPPLIEHIKMQLLQYCGYT